MTVQDVLIIVISAASLIGILILTVRKPYRTWYRFEHMDMVSLQNIINDLCAEITAIMDADRLVEEVENCPEEALGDKIKVSGHRDGEGKFSASLFFHAPGQKDSLLKYLKEQRELLLPPLLRSVERLGEWRGQNVDKSLPPSGILAGILKKWRQFQAEKEVMDEPDDEEFYDEESDDEPDDEADENGDEPEPEDTAEYHWVLWYSRKKDAVLREPYDTEQEAEARYSELLCQAEEDPDVVPLTSLYGTRKDALSVYNREGDR